MTGMRTLDALRLTSIADDEGPKGEKAAFNSRDDIESQSTTRAKLVNTFNKYNLDMRKAGRSYRYG
jgi:hypothetical protein